MFCKAFVSFRPFWAASQFPTFESPHVVNKLTSGPVIPTFIYSDLDAKTFDQDKAFSDGKIGMAMLK